MLLEQDEVRRRAGEIKLISIDLDGTLLNEARELTPRSATAIRGLLDRGYLVVPTTGRALSRSIQIYPALEGSQYAISTNGALLTDLSKGEHLYRNAIPLAEALRLIPALLDNAGSMIYLNTLNNCRTAYQAQRDFPAPGQRKPFGVEPDTADSLCAWLEASGEEVLEIGLHFEREDGYAHYEPLAATQFPGLDCFRVGPNNIEFVAVGTSKASALKRLCEHLDLSPAQVCALGDNGNDVDTLRLAGLGVAMANAIQPVREAANYVTTLSNDEEGAAQFLEDFFLS